MPASVLAHARIRELFADPKAGCGAAAQFWKGMENMYENREKGGSALSGFLRGVMIVLFIFSFAIVFVLYMKPLYYLDIVLMNLVKASGRDAETIKRNYDAVISYMYLWNRGPLNFPGFAMSEHGRIHFSDCKKIFDAVQILCAVSGLWTLIAFIRHRHSLRYRYLRNAGIAAILVPAALIVLAVLDWSRFFTAFHQIFFRNNYWLFDPATDPIILVLPDAFFLQCVVVIVLLVLIGGILCILRAGRKKRRLQANLEKARGRRRR